METLKENSIVTGHHIYKSIWSPFIGEMLPAEIEEGNLYDRYAVSLIRDRKIVRHMLCSISKVSWHFLKHGGKIKCEVTSKRKKGNGLEVPCQRFSDFL